MKGNSTYTKHRPARRRFKVLKMANGRKPQYIQVDEGNEFINNIFKSLCRRENINLFNFNSDKKACVVERFTRKDEMCKTFTDRNSHKYIDTLDDLIHSYNYTDHRSIHTKPALVTTDVEDRVWHAPYDNVYGEKEKSSFKFEFKVGDIVRYKVWKDMRFDKSYTQSLH